MLSRICAPLLLLIAVVSAQQPSATQDSDWHKRFEEQYALADNQVLNRIGPPFIRERETYYRTEHRSQAERIKDPPDYFTFHYDGKLHNWGMGFSGGESQPLSSVLTNVLDFKTYEFEGPKEILSIKLAGDWVVRSGAEPAALIEALAGIVNSTGPKQIQFKQAELQREVIVAEGEFEFHPLSGTYEDKWVHLYVDTRDSDEGSGGGSGNLEKFLQMLGSRVNMPVIDDTRGKQPANFSWGHHSSSRLSNLPAGEDKTEKVKKLLDVVSEQTNLKFTIEQRPVQVWVISEKAADAPATAPGAAATDKNADVEALAKEFDARLHRARYMESKEVRDVAIAGWDGFPTKRYTYSVTDKDGTVKTADVVMLNPTAGQIAQWIVSALLEVKGNYDVSAGRKVFANIIGQSGGQFPVTGVVYEDIIPADGKNEVYCFRDGVTVQIDGVKHRTTDPLSAKEIETSIDGKVTRVFTYARIQSTSPQQWIDSGGAADVLKDGKPTEKWLETVRAAYQKAWTSPRNELLVAWVKANVK